MYVFLEFLRSVMWDRAHVTELLGLCLSEASKCENWNVVALGYEGEYCMLLSHSRRIIRTLLLVL